MFCSVQQTSWALPLRKSSRWMTGSKAEGHKLVMGASGSPIWGFLFGGSVWETCQRKSVLWWALLGWISSMYAKKCVCVCVCVCVYICVCVCVYQQVQSGSLRHEWLVDEEKDKQAVWGAKNNRAWVPVECVRFTELFRVIAIQFTHPERSYQTSLDM